MQKCIFKTETVILWDSDNPASITHVLWKLQDLFVIRFSGFLKHVGSLMRLFKLSEQQKSFIDSSSTHDVEVKTEKQNIFVFGRKCM